MLRRTISILVAAVVCIAGVSGLNLAGTANSRAASGQRSAALSPDSQRGLVEQYCTDCHNASLLAGGMDLEALDLARIAENAELAEKMIRKVRAGMMPPAGQARPDATTLNRFARSLEEAIDRVAAQQPHVDAPELHRLNRTEYSRSIRDLLGVTVDVSELLPTDAGTAGFDNMADALTVTPTLMQAYVRAAERIARLAVGDPDAPTAMVQYDVPKVVNQMRHLEGAPFGTRGGVSVIHDFPADGEYSFQLELYYYYTGELVGSHLPGSLVGQELEISVDGERVAVFTIDPEVQETEGLLQTDPIPIKAGQRRLSAAFVAKADGPVEDQYRLVEHTLMDVTIANQPGMSALPHLRTLSVTGPFNPTGVSDTASRREIFTCHPASASQEPGCATEIITRLAGKAFRRPTTAEDLEALMGMYRLGYGVDGFEGGVRTAIQAIVAKPEFVFRFERVPDNLEVGAIFPVDDIELASRLSYFLWSSAPDDDLIAIAAEGRLSEPGVLDQQVVRMLSDPRSEALATNFASQWLRLRDLKQFSPEPTTFPDFTRNLAESMQREVELLFDSILRNDRSLLDLLRADYTFVDETLALHYGLPNVTGNRFRRVTLSDPNRFGLVGKAAVLAMTSLANRTSPVARGKYVLEVLLGTPPPPPPPVVPPFPETVNNEKVLTVRERMEAHRQSPACSACHQIMDPIGLALENFDATGRWRNVDGGFEIDATGSMYDGIELDGPVSVREAILDHSASFIGSFTEKLLAYALGRVLDYRDMPTVRSISQTAAENDNRLSYFIMGVVNSAPFQMRTVTARESAAENENR